MPPKKKQPRNAFYFFMVERKGHYERNGERFPNGLKDVAELVDTEWKVAKYIFILALDFSFRMFDLLYRLSSISIVDDFPNNETDTRCFRNYYEVASI